MSAGKVEYQISLDHSQLLAGFQAAREGFAKLAEGAMAAGSIIGISLASFKGVEGMAEAFKGVVEAGLELKRTAQVTGETVGNIVILKKALQETGVDGGSVQHMLVMLQSALGGVNAEGQPTHEIFQRLGLSLQQLKGESAVEQLDQISKAISGLKTQADRIAAVREMFGRSGEDMMALLGNPEAIGEAQKSAGGVADIYQRNAKIFAEVALSFEALGQKMRGFWAGISEGLAPAVFPLLKALNSINLTGIGTQIGNTIKVITAAFKSGNLGELLWLSFELAVNKLGNALIGTATGAAAALGAGLSADWNQFIGFFSNLGSVWDGLKFGMISAIQAAGAVLLEVFQKPILMMQAGLEYSINQVLNKLPGWVQDKLGIAANKESFQDIYKQKEREGANLFGLNSGDLAGKATENANKAAEAFSKLSKAMQIKSDFEGIITAFKEGFSQGGNALDTSTIIAALNGKIADLQALVPKLEDAGGKKNNTPSINTTGFNPGVMTDSLARIGAFVGRGGPAGARYVQDTEKNTRQTAEHLKTLVSGGLKVTGLTSGALF